MYPDVEESRKRDCLARHICTIGSVEKRREFIAALRLRHGELFAKDIENRVTDEWEKRRDAMQAKNNHNPGAEAMGVLRAEPRHTETAVLSDQGEKEHSQ